MSPNAAISSTSVTSRLDDIVDRVDLKSSIFIFKWRHGRVRRTSSCADLPAQQVMIATSSTATQSVVNCVMTAFNVPPRWWVSPVACSLSPYSSQPADDICQCASRRGGLAGCWSHRRHRLIPGEWQNDPGRRPVRHRTRTVHVDNDCSEASDDNANENQLEGGWLIYDYERWQSDVSGSNDEDASVIDRHVVCITYTVRGRGRSMTLNPAQRRRPGTALSESCHDSVKYSSSMRRSRQSSTMSSNLFSIDRTFSHPIELWSTG